MGEQEQTGWVDITHEVEEMERQRAADTELQSIELDCAPAMPRPGDWINYVLKDTGLAAGEPVAKFFGNWRWEWWEQRIVPLVKPRIISLYERGAIRYGSW